LTENSGKLSRISVLLFQANL